MGRLDQYQIPLLEPTSDWRPPAEYPDLSGASRIAIDLETRDPGLIDRGAGWARGEGHIIGVSVATDEFCGYFPIRHENGGNLDAEMTMRWLRGEVSRSHQPKIFANAMYDCGWLARENIIPEGPLYDVQFAAPLLDEDRLTYRLDALAKDYLGDRKDEKLLREAAKSWGANPKSQMYRMPANFVGPYAEQDAAITLRLWDYFRPRLEEESLWEVFCLESDLLPLLIAMRWRGVRVDVDGAERLRDTWLADEKAIAAEIKRRWLEVDIWNNGMVSKAFDFAGIQYPRTETGLPSFRADWLSTVDHDLPRLLVQGRKLSKARGTFVEGYILDQSRNGRLHPEFHPLRSDDGGTVSGRFSCANPNLQNIPKRDPLVGVPIRRLFLPEEGCQWFGGDFSQQEPRLTVHYAALAECPGASDAVDFYSSDPDADYHSMVAEMAGIGRQQAKMINLGLAYGMGATKLAAQLGLTAADAEELFRQYHERVPFVKALADTAARKANTAGFVRTLSGRKCRFPFFEPANYELSQARWRDRSLRRPIKREEAERIWPGQPLRRSFTHSALNRVIQGSAADMTKLAMRDAWRAGKVPHLQIHDELTFSVERLEDAEELLSLMKNCVQLLVPVKVDGVAGPTWGDAK
jgi:DNA polymerase I-like protein with 3'-5' exonuclease and polymerase domains